MTETGTILNESDVNVTPVVEFQDKATYAAWQLGAQFSKHLVNQHFMFLRFITFNLVACNDAFHACASDLVSAKCQVLMQHLRARDRSDGHAHQTPSATPQPHRRQSLPQNLLL